MINSHGFVCWLDMINLCGFYAGNNVKVVKDDKNIQSIFRQLESCNYCSQRQSKDGVVFRSTKVAVGLDWMC